MKGQVKNIFVEGSISGHFIAEKIVAHQSRTAIGGHSIFLGQVRADILQDKKVMAIEYTSYPEMALDLMQQVREEFITRYALTCMHVYHSLGKIAVGEI